MSATYEGALLTTHVDDPYGVVLDQGPGCPEDYNPTVLEESETRSHRTFA